MKKMFLSALACVAFAGSAFASSDVCNQKQEDHFIPIGELHGHCINAGASAINALQFFGVPDKIDNGKSLYQETYKNAYNACILTEKK